MQKTRALVQKVVEELEQKAGRAGTFYAVCLWFSPMSSDLNERHIFYDDPAEGIAWKKQMIETYTRYGFPFYVESDCYDCDYDGGLFDETQT